jgi:hypothetical protein
VYGKQNAQWLRNYGFTPILLSESAVVDFNGVGNREYEGRGPRGTFNYGISMWQHKSYAIQRAFDYGVDEVVWVDWDTSIKGDLKVLDELINGPPFQGRMRHYKQRWSGGGRYFVYHGGCYYMRSPDVFVECDKVRPSAPYVTDEAIVTTAVNNVFFGGREATVEEHRAAGYDNPRLHSLRVNAMGSNEQSVFFEGEMKRSPPFEIETKNPQVVYTNNAKNV